MQPVEAVILRCGQRISAEHIIEFTNPGGQDFRRDLVASFLARKLISTKLRTETRKFGPTSWSPCGSTWCKRLLFTLPTTCEQKECVGVCVVICVCVLWDCATLVAGVTLLPKRLWKMCQQGPWVTLLGSVTSIASRVHPSPPSGGFLLRTVPAKLRSAEFRPQNGRVVVGVGVSGRRQTNARDSDRHYAWGGHLVE